MGRKWMADRERRPASAGAPIPAQPDQARPVPAARIALKPRWARTESLERDDSREPIDRNEPTESTDRADPIEATDSTDPTEPMDSTDPSEQIDRTESVDHSDQRDEPLRF